MGSDGCIFGIGENSMGELGLSHTKCVDYPEPLMFFRDLNNRATRQFGESFGLAPPRPDEKCLNRDKGCGGRKPFRPYFPNGRLGGGYRC